MWGCCYSRGPFSTVPIHFSNLDLCCSPICLNMALGKSCTIELNCSFWRTSAAEMNSSDDSQKPRFFFQKIQRLPVLPEGTKGSHGRDLPSCRGQLSSLSWQIKHGWSTVMWVQLALNPPFATYLWWVRDGLLLVYPHQCLEGENLGRLDNGMSRQT